MGFYKEKTCQHCGGNYSGTASSRYCLECKVDIMAQQKKESTARWKERKKDENIRSN